MWISLSIMISDSVVSLIVVTVRTLLHFVSSVRNSEKELATQAVRDISQPIESSEQFSSSVEPTHTDTNHSMNKGSDNDSTETTQSVQMLRDVSKKHLVPNAWVFCGLTFSCILCVVSTRAVFGTVIPVYAIVISVIMSLFLSILGVKALGETDLNPVSGIGKLSQLICALCVPKNTRGSILINLISGAISEATTQQAGDLMHTLNFYSFMQTEGIRSRYHWTEGAIKISGYYYIKHTYSMFPDAVFIVFLFVTGVDAIYRCCFFYSLFLFVIRFLFLQPFFYFVFPFLHLS